MDDDLLLALRLQKQYDQEAEEQTWRSSKEIVRADAVDRPRDLSIVDPSWELLDPNPDVHALFIQFNQIYFWGKLTGVEVKWSSRMTLCAGVCSYEGRGGLCSIRLSKPLLSLRPRKDLVQTLLHEMIHALLFVTHNNKDRDSHGPEFLKHMNRINGLTGAKISVYHSFHEEVDEYRKHWWRCNGRCQYAKPYFGYVKRSMNRAPSANDHWWAEHQRTCGGTFTKVKEPEPTSHKDKTQKKVSESQAKDMSKGTSNGVDIRTFMPFSGKGYTLGESSQSLQTKKIQTVIPSSPTPVSFFKPESFSEPVSKFPNYRLLNVTTSSIKTKSKVPKISVANTKMFISVGGSPVKLPYKNRNVTSTVTTSETSTNMSQKRISSGMMTSSQSASSTSQETKAEGHSSQAPKRPRMDTSQGIKLFFPKVTGVSTTSNKQPINIPRDQQSPISQATSSSQHKKVQCPVCGAEVPEANINDHLDTCLS